MTAVSENLRRGPAAVGKEARLAVRQFATAYGRNWRAKLGGFLMAGVTDFATLIPMETRTTLQALRNNPYAIRHVLSKSFKPFADVPDAPVKLRVRDMTPEQLREYKRQKYRQMRARVEADPEAFAAYHAKRAEQQRRFRKRHANKKRKSR